MICTDLETYKMVLLGILSNYSLHTSFTIYIWIRFLHLSSREQSSFWQNASPQLQMTVNSCGTHDSNTLVVVGFIGTLYVVMYHFKKRYTIKQILTWNVVAWLSFINSAVISSLSVPGERNESPRTRKRASGCTRVPGKPVPENAAVH